MTQGNKMPCTWCGQPIYKAPSKQFTQNFCCQECRLKWLGKNNIENLNLPGHSIGHKAPHLTRMNKLRNPSGSLHTNSAYVDSRVYRSIVEKAIGRKLSSTEVVHHINGNRTDNRLENLQVMGKSEHCQLHMKIAVERFRKGGDEKCQKK
jgi:endogenous inhibitor of DNA gyrase (YacG/DUF329 family)